MTAEWTRAAADYLADTSTCPRCGVALGVGPVCGQCGADLSGPAAVRLREVSDQIVEQLRVRVSVLDALPTVPHAGADPHAVPDPDATMVPGMIPNWPAGADWAAPAAGPPRRSAESTVGFPSVLSVIGAALIAVAALVFAFLGSDVTDLVGRTTVLLVTTAVFALGAGLLTRARLTFSAEAVGALAAVFAGLDVGTIAGQAGADAALSAAVGTAIASALLFVGGWLLRLRTWTWSALVGGALVPVICGFAVGSGVPIALGFAVAAGAAVAEHGLMPRLATRLGAAPAVERSTATVLAFALTGAALIADLVVWNLLGGIKADPSTIVGQAIVVVLLAIVALAGARTPAGTAWSLLAGALFTLGSVVLLAATRSTDEAWGLLAFPAAAGATVVLCALVVRLRGGAARFRGTSSSSAPGWSRSS